MKAPVQHRADLATIVLADERARRVAREDANPYALEHEGPGFSGYDARSALVLAVVVALLAAVAGWTMAIGNRTDPNAAVQPRSQAAEASSSTQSALAVSRAATPTPPRAAVARRHGVDLAARRIVATQSASGGLLVRVAVANAGDQPVADGSGARVTLLVDGSVAASGPLAAIGASGGVVTSELSLTYCPSGRHSVVVVVDPGVGVSDANGHDNAIRRMMSFGC